MQENINIPDSNITTNLSFRQLVIMNMQQLTNFPYIEKDFDALTDYELLCLVVKFLNDVITNQNEQNASITRLYESFLALQNYVNNTKDTLEDAFNNLDNYVRYYFNNLDVQEEINNKLDSMAESGELTDIIAQYLQLAGLLCFNTKSDMKNASNLTNGSFAKTYGNETYNDGKGNFYKIRTILNTDVVDDINIIALTNYNNLIAELMPNFYITNLQNQINDITSDDIVVLLGDSYGIHNPHDWYSWSDKLAELRNWTEGVNYFNFCTGNSGLTVADNNYYSNLRSNENRILDKTKVKTFIIAGGYNDNYYFSGSMTDSDYENALNTLVTYIKSNYPNAKIYMGMIGNSKALDGTGIRGIIIDHALFGYSKIAKYDNCFYMDNVECVMRRYDYFIDDNTHPNENGAKMLAYAINKSVYENGFIPIFDKASINFSSAYINIRQIGSNLEFSLTGSCYPTIEITDNVQTTINSTYVIDNTAKYIRNVSDTYSRIPFIANVTCSDNTTSCVKGLLLLTSDTGTIRISIFPTSDLIGKTIGRLDFKFNPVLLPIIYF